MDLVIPPTIYVAGPKSADPAVARSSRQPVKAPPIPEPATETVRGFTARDNIDPISLPPVLNAKGQLAVPTGTGTRLDVLA